MGFVHVVAWRNGIKTFAQFYSAFGVAFQIHRFIFGDGGKRKYLVVHPKSQSVGIEGCILRGVRERKTICSEVEVVHFFWLLVADR